MDVNLTQEELGALIQWHKDEAEHDAEREQYQSAAYHQQRWQELERLPDRSRR